MKWFIIPFNFLRKCNRIFTK